MVKSVLTTTSETTEDDSDDESATYHDSVINLDKVYKHWKKHKSKEKQFELNMYITSFLF